MFSDLHIFIFQDINGRINSCTLLNWYTKSIRQPWTRNIITQCTRIIKERERKRIVPRVCVRACIKGWKLFVIARSMSRDTPAWRQPPFPWQATIYPTSMGFAVVPAASDSASDSLSSFPCVSISTRFSFRAANSLSLLISLTLRHRWWPRIVSSPPWPHQRQPTSILPNRLFTGLITHGLSFSPGRAIARGLSMQSRMCFSRTVSNAFLSRVANQRRWTCGIVQIFSGLYRFLNQIQSPRESRGITTDLRRGDLYRVAAQRVVAIVPTVGHESRRRRFALTTIRYYSLSLIVCLGG